MTGLNSTPPLFRETQYFRQLWIWALVMFISLLSLYGAVQQVVFGEQFGNNPAPDVALVVIAVIFGLGLPVFLYTANLTTEVRDDGLYFRFFPFHLSFRKIGPEDISDFEAQTYRPIRDYGGWGIRFGRKGRAYNVRGNRGVQLELASGKQILFGSQKPEEMAAALSTIVGRK
jgi:hypothetical protein